MCSLGRLVKENLKEKGGLTEDALPNRKCDRVGRVGDFMMSEWRRSWVLSSTASSSQESSLLRRVAYGIRLMRHAKSSIDAGELNYLRVILKQDALLAMYWLWEANAVHSTAETSK